ncbi:cyanophycin synthetase [Fluoribacter dumoffii]|uniref:Cyanophycin synthetase n=1 Tax=Fluoribacter dumoffii TaxID=463 RepID=A0A377GC10_9GAMM|nr:cyanophycin synthetase [Fluoribacter dumoffii]KTC90665.1 cyanophycin synthetase [Fluoribacter dumoffii NY 23]MCW8386345.1 cyanophycin synthetase [Fluoribacter dumoffii]MCW8419398.1 cyanophycin synthetase [Fluoribacter dumoffii]MCW8452727.1 cyanophycin synthetase [Fluoribacter dumoffii]MCW8460023.1 cyanophycin synthetase [Fluoribacter dumoffii]
MNILETKILNGPNYWSNYRKELIVIKLDLEKYEELPTNRLAGFKERLVQELPSLKSHRCSLGVEGGFLERVEEGTWLGHVIEHVALELQYLAGMDCGFGRTYGTKDYGVYHVIFAYQIEEAGLHAGKTAVEFIRSIAEGKKYPLEEAINHLKEIFKRKSLGPSTQALVEEAKRRKIPWKRHNNTSLITFGYGRNQKKIWASVSSKTSSIGVDIASDKELTKHILRANFIPTPEGMIINSEESLKDAIAQLGFPLVIKPHNGNHGKGVTTHITDLNKAYFGYELAKKISNELIIERFITGNDYRFLVINYKVVAVAERTPPQITGNGKLTINELIKQVNEDPNRGESHENILTKIKIDESTFSILKQNNLTLESILPVGHILKLKETANLSSGGTARDVTDIVHPFNISLAERVARLVNLDICGIDVISQDIGCPLNENSGAVIEVNAGPGLRMHLSPNEGMARNVAEPILNMLYPANLTSRIPVVAVTGTNGKTTVVRLIAHLARFVNHHTGYTTTEGIYINNKLIYSGDCSGPASAQVVLYDPEVDYAVLECARGGILRSGLGFDECDISVITNVTGDHLELNDIHTLEEMAEVKAVVARSTKDTGYAILNADNNFTYDLRNDLHCNIALFSMFDSPHIRKHCSLGGLAAYLDQGNIIVQRGSERITLADIKSIPLSFQGTATGMMQNILAAVLAGVISHFSLEKIKEALQVFYPTVENLPGRMNLFRFPHCQIMVDYAHNEGAYCELKNYIDSLQCAKKIGIIGVVGDRRDEDIEKLGYHVASMFDEIVIRHDKDGRGRTHHEINRLLVAGILRSHLKPSLNIISDEIEAIEHMMEIAEPNTFIFCAVEDVFETTNFLKKKEKQFKMVNEVYNDTQG